MGPAELSHGRERQRHHGPYRSTEGKGRDDGYAVYFHCQSGLVEIFRTIYLYTFTYEGKRALLFGTKGRLPVRELRHCLALALTHHARKKSGKAA